MESCKYFTHKYCSESVFYLMKIWGVQNFTKAAIWRFTVHKGTPFSKECTLYLIPNIYLNNSGTCIEHYLNLSLTAKLSVILFKFSMLSFICTKIHLTDTSYWSYWSDFDRLYQSVYGFIFIMLGIIWKLDYLSFHWYFICHDCFAETCAGRLNWVQCQKINVAKLDNNFNRWYQFVYEIIFIMLGIIWKPIYCSFNWYVICYDCLSGTCAKWLY